MGDLDDPDCSQITWFTVANHPSEHARSRVRDQHYMSSSAFLQHAREQLDAAGFGIGSACATTTAAASSSDGDPTSASAELAVQSNREVAARTEVTAAALEAANSLVEFDGYLKRSAAPAAAVLRQESEEMRANLKTISSLGTSVQAAVDDEDIT